MKTETLSKLETFHVVLLAKNLTGLKNLYRLVSESHINYFHRRPRIPKTLLETYREGLIVGSACEAGELYKAILNNKSESEIRNIVNFYDLPRNPANWKQYAFNKEWESKGRRGAKKH